MISGDGAVGISWSQRYSYCQAQTPPPSQQGSLGYYTTHCVTPLPHLFLCAAAQVEMLSLYSCDVHAYMLEAPFNMLFPHYILDAAVQVPLLFFNAYSCDLGAHSALLHCCASSKDSQSHPLVSTASCFAVIYCCATLLFVIQQACSMDAVQTKYALRSAFHAPCANNSSSDAFPCAEGNHHLECSLQWSC